MCFWLKTRRREEYFCRSGAGLGPKTISSWEYKHTLSGAHSSISTGDVHNYHNLVEASRLTSLYRHCTAWASLIVLAILLHNSIPSQAQELLSPDEAFRYNVSASEDMLTVRWDIEPGHYLYRDRMAFASTTNGVVLGAPMYPQSENYNDKYFGSTAVYKEGFSVSIPWRIDKREISQSIAVELTSQGCNVTIGVCYPKQLWTVQLCRTFASVTLFKPSVVLLVTASTFGTPTQAQRIEDTAHFHEQLTGHYYRDDIVAYLASNFAFSEPWKDAKHYYSTVQRRVSAEGLHASDFYELYVFKPRALIPESLLRAYLKAASTDYRYQLHGRSKYQLYSLEHSNQSGWLASKVNDQQDRIIHAEICDVEFCDRLDSTDKVVRYSMKNPLPVQGITMENLEIQVRKGDAGSEK